MKERAVIEAVLEECLWRGEERRERYKYILSPDLYEIGSVQLGQLEELGPALRTVLLGVGRLATIALNPDLAYSRTWQVFGKALGVGIPSVYRDIQVKEPRALPVLCKVDLVQGNDGRYYIAEIDGHNKHGLGYMALHARVAKLLRPGVRVLPGVVKVITDHLRSLGETKLCLLYAHKERFYLSEFEVLQASLAEEGVELVVVDEVDVRISGLKLSTALGALDCRVFVDLPFMDKNTDLAKALAELYLQGAVRFLLPPRPFFSSKAVLGLIRNDQGNEELETILRSQIPGQALGTLRSFIPETFLIGPGRSKAAWRELAEQGYVLKETISSGMKGTLFLDERAKFEEMMSLALRSPYRFILQREIENQPMRFRYFADCDQVLEDTWFSRIIVQFAGREMAEIELTARKDKRVHGAPDCLQLGTVLV